MGCPTFLEISKFGWTWNLDTSYLQLSRRHHIRPPFYTKTLQKIANVAKHHSLTLNQFHKCCSLRFSIFQELSKWSQSLLSKFIYHSMSLSTSITTSTSISMSILMSDILLINRQECHRSLRHICSDLNYVIRILVTHSLKSS